MTIATGTATKYLGRLLGGVHRALIWTVVALLAVEAVLLIVQVVARYVFSASQHWIDETARIGLVWLVFLGAAVLVRERRHMVISYLADKLPARAAQVVAVVGTVFLIVILAVILSGAVDAWQAAARIATPSLGLPRTVLTAPVVIGFGLSLVFSLELLARSLVGADPPPRQSADEDLAID